MKLTPPAILLILSVSHVTVFSQQPIFKSDFEQPIVGPVPGYRPYSNGDTVAGWLITEGDVDLVSKNFAFFGLSSQVLDLNGSVPGAIQRQVVTTPSLVYHLTWQSQANPIVEDALKQYHAEVLWNGQRVFDWSRTFLQGPPIEQFSVYITGTGNDTLAFRSLAINNGGYFLDDITFTQVPEPTVLALLSLGLSALIYRRRR